MHNDQPFSQTNKADNAHTPAFWLFFVFLGSCTAICWNLSWGGYENISWNLFAGGRIIDGAVPYRDFIDTNPPLILWFSAAVVYGARHLTIDALLFFNLITTSLAIFSFWWCYRLIPTSFFARYAHSTRIWILVSYFLLPLALTCYGEREHFFVICILPWFFSYGPHSESSRKNWPMVLFATGAILFKPFFFLLPTLLCAHAFHRSKRFFLSFSRLLFPLLAAGIYLELMTLYTPDFFQKALPLLLRYYPFYGNGLEATGRPLLLLGLTLVIPLSMVRTYTDNASSACSLCCWSTLVLALSVLIQAKGFPYHYYPFVSFLLLTLTVLRTFSVPQAVRKLYHRSLTTGGVLCVLWVCTTLPGRLAYARHMREVTHFLSPFRGMHLSTLSPNLLAFPLVPNLDMSYCQRFHHLWMIPGLTQHGSTDPEELVQYVSTSTSCGVPDLYLVDTSHRWKILDTLMKDDSFRQHWSHYSLIGSSPGFSLLTQGNVDIYQRTGAHSK